MWTIEQIYKNLEGRGARYEKGIDGLSGALVKYNIQYSFIFSYGGGWEHLSVSTKKRTPTWEEMCFFKDMFWPDTQCCIQYHPAKSEYVNRHPYCLHIWNPIEVELPTPPMVFV